MECNPIIFVIEDDFLIRASLADAFRQAGFVVLESETGEDAIVVLGATEIAAVVTDIRLGSEMSGWDVGRFARRHNPRMPVVYMTGDSAAEWATEGVPSSVIVQKPFAIAQVVAAVSNLLNAIDQLSI